MKILVKAVDVVPVATEDPRGVVFSSSVFPLTICGIIIGAFVTMARGLARPRHRVLTLLVACAVAAFGIYVVAQGFLGALPHSHVATWAILSLDLISISATAAGVIRLFGPAGLGLSAALMVFIGNAFSGATSAPEMLPKGVEDIGQWLPPGAGASLLRDTAYFDGNGGGGHLAVLILWSVIGLTAVMFGHWVMRESRGARDARTAAKTDAKTDVVASGELLPALPGAASLRRTGVTRTHTHTHTHAATTVTAEQRHTEAAAGRPHEPASRRGLPLPRGPHPHLRGCGPAAPPVDSKNSHDYDVRREALHRDASRQTGADTHDDHPTTR